MNIPWATWAYYGYVTQVVGVPTPIGIKFDVGADNEIRLLHAAVKVGTVGAARDVVLHHNDSADTTLMILMSDGLDSNQIIYGPATRQHGSTVTADTVAAIGTLEWPHAIRGTDYLQLEGASLANTELLYIWLRALVRRGLPTISAVGTGISLGSTNVYSKVL